MCHTHTRCAHYSKEFLVGKGVKSTGAIGFCWGAWVVFKLSAAGTLPTLLLKTNGMVFFSKPATHTSTHNRHDLGGR